MGHVLYEHWNCNNLRCHDNFGLIALLIGSSCDERSSRRGGEKSSSRIDWRLLQFSHHQMFCLTLTWTQTAEPTRSEHLCYLAEKNRVMDRRRGFVELLASLLPLRQPEEGRVKQAQNRLLLLIYSWCKFTPNRCRENRKVKRISLNLITAWHCCLNVVDEGGLIICVIEISQAMIR